MDWTVLARFGKILNIFENILIKSENHFIMFTLKSERKLSQMAFVTLKECRRLPESNELITSILEISLMQCVCVFFVYVLLFWCFVVVALFALSKIRFRNRKFCELEAVRHITFNHNYAHSQCVLYRSILYKHVYRVKRPVQSLKTLWMNIVDHIHTVTDNDDVDQLCIESVIDKFARDFLITFFFLFRVHCWNHIAFTHGSCQ